MEFTPTATAMQRAFYNYFHHTFIDALVHAMNIFPPSPELSPSIKGQLVVRAFVHSTCVGRDANGNVVATTTREEFIESMARHYDQTMLDLMVTNANHNSAGG